MLFAMALVLCAASGRPTNLPPHQDNMISIEYPEVYELANIVLALTEYGINDKWQVRKDFGYYEEMRAYFKPYEDHPLLDSVNFSRERWQEYLSYRTDSYAFVFDENNRLKRVNDFQSFEINTFDKFRSLTEDFAIKSDFRKFYHSHSNYYKQIIEYYKKEYLLEEMKNFLAEEFGNYFAEKKYSIVVSPFVYAQNLHRDIDSTWTADFPNIAKPIIEGTGFENIEDKSTEIHTLFTEMDHGYVNPTTDRFDTKKFDEKIWDDGSGYSGGRNDVFNEYMTWAVFDIFNSRYFPQFADRVNLNWHFQNDTRGFIYSDLFAEKLKELYNKYRGTKTIKDIYPELLEWAEKVQYTLTKPLLLNDSDTLWIVSNPSLIELEFSEPMAETENFDIVLQFDQWDKQVVEIGKKNNIKWEDDGKKLSFETDLPKKDEYYLLFNWWGVEKPVKSKKGITLKATSGLIIK